jgi:hypothetical protein
MKSVRLRLAVRFKTEEESQRTASGRTHPDVTGFTVEAIGFNESAAYMNAWALVPEQLVKLGIADRVKEIRVEKTDVTEKERLVLQVVIEHQFIKRAVYDLISSKRRFGGENEEGDGEPVFGLFGIDGKPLTWGASVAFVTYDPEDFVVLAHLLDAWGLKYETEEGK